MYSNGEVIFEAVKQMVELSSAAQEQCDRHSMCDFAWAKELCTVKVAGPRAGGHTTAIPLISEYFSDNCAYVFPNFQIARDYRRYYHRIESAREQNRKKDDQGHKERIFSVTDLDLLRGLFEPGEVEAVICDVSNMLSSRKKDEIYLAFSSLASRSEKFFFIFLQ